MADQFLKDKQGYDSDDSYYAEISKRKDEFGEPIQGGPFKVKSRKKAKSPADKETSQDGDE